MGGWGVRGGREGAWRAAVTYVPHTLIHSLMQVSHIESTVQKSRIAKCTVTTVFPEPWNRLYSPETWRYSYISASTHGAATTTPHLLHHIVHEQPHQHTNRNTHAHPNTILTLTEHGEKLDWTCLMSQAFSML